MARRYSSSLPVCQDARWPSPPLQSKWDQMLEFWPVECGQRSAPFPGLVNGALCKPPFSLSQSCHLPRVQGAPPESCAISGGVARGTAWGLCVFVGRIPPPTQPRPFPRQPYLDSKEWPTNLCCLKLLRRGALTHTGSQRGHPVIIFGNNLCV